METSATSTSHTLAPAQPARSRRVAASPVVVQVDHLTKRFGSLVAVDDLTFGIEAGTVTGFLGPNGAGKTTTLRMLLGLIRPTAGEALVLGRHYAEHPNPARRVGPCSSPPTSTRAARGGST